MSGLAPLAHVGRRHGQVGDVDMLEFHVVHSFFQTTATGPGEAGRATKSGRQSRRWRRAAPEGPKCNGGPPAQPGLRRAAAGLEGSVRSPRLFGAQASAIAREARCPLARSLSSGPASVDRNPHGPRRPRRLGGASAP
jgi:hypothetical protein